MYLSAFGINCIDHDRAIASYIATTTTTTSSVCDFCVASAAASAASAVVRAAKRRKIFMNTVITSQETFRLRLVNHSALAQEVHHFVVSATTTIPEIKLMLFQTAGVAVKSQSLFYNDVLLNDLNTLEQCGIESDGAEIYYSYTTADVEFGITIANQAHVLSLCVTKDTTVLQLKHMYKYICNRPIKYQTFLYNSHILQDLHTMEQNGVKKDAVLFYKVDESAWEL